MGEAHVRGKKIRRQVKGGACKGVSSSPFVGLAVDQDAFELVSSRQRQPGRYALITTAEDDLVEREDPSPISIGDVYIPPIICRVSKHLCDRGLEPHVFEQLEVDGVGVKVLSHLLPRRIGRRVFSSWSLDKSDAAFYVGCLSYSPRDVPFGKGKSLNPVYVKPVSNPDLWYNSTGRAAEEKPTTNLLMLHTVPSMTEVKAGLPL